MTTREDMRLAAEEMDSLKDTGREFDGLVRVKAKVSREPNATLIVEMKADELSAISIAAQEAGETVSEFITKAALTRAEVSTPPPPVGAELRLYPVDSTSVELIGYDGESRALYVRFRGGGLYRYEGVEASVVKDLLKADSTGRYLNSVVKPRYRVRQITHLPRGRRFSQA